MLGLGRAIGETIAATLVIGNAPDIGQDALLTGVHAGRGDRQRVRRGGVRSDAPRGADRRRPRAVRLHPVHQRRRAYFVVRGEQRTARNVPKGMAG